MSIAKRQSRVVNLSFDGGGGGRIDLGFFLFIFLLKKSLLDQNP